MPSRLFGCVAMAVFVAVVAPSENALGFDFGGGAPVPVARPVAPPAYPPAVSAPERIIAVDPDKKLLAGDKVTIEIVEDREAGLPRVVTSAGELDVPPLGRVRVAGQTAEAAAANIKRLLEKDYYYSATVRLSIDEVGASRVQQGSVLISGAVAAQGPQPLLAGESRTLADAVLRAGTNGWSELRKVKVTRVKKDGGMEQFQVDVQKIIETGNLERTDPVLQDGDRIHVPTKRIRF
jgi:protein involved in polysaccharide export with SLBB domain